MKRQLSFMLALVLTVFLVACNTNGDIADNASGLTQQQEYVAMTCASASAAMKVVTVAINADKLDAEQRADVLAASDKIARVCASPTPPTMTQLQEIAFSEAVAVIAVMAAKHRSPD